MSKLLKAQSKTGRNERIAAELKKFMNEPTLVEKMQFMERKEDDKTEIDGLRVDRGPSPRKKGRKKPKGVNLAPKARKRPNSNRGK